MNLQNSLLKKTTAGLFTAATVLTMAAASTTAFATEINESDNTFYNKGGDMNITLKKTLDFSEGVTLPKGEDNQDLWFAFQIEAKSSTVFENKDDMPKLGTDTVTDSAGTEFNNVVKIGGFATDADNDGKNDKNTAEGIITLESADIIDDSQFKRAGEYVYTVKELGTSNFLENKLKAGDDAADWFKDSMTYDDTELELHILVKNKEDGTGCYVSSAYFTKRNSNTNDNTGSEDSAVGGYNRSSDIDALCDHVQKIDKVQPIFSNTYVKEAGKNPNANNSKSSLGITKTVAGDYADKEKSFDFTIKVQALTNENVLKQVIKEASAADNPWSSITVEGDKITQLTAYVQDIKNYDKVPGVEDTDVTPVTLTLKNGYYTADFKLKDGQYLTFVSLPAGFKYNVTESNTKGFTPSATLFENVDLRNDDSLISTQNPIQQRLATIEAGNGFSTASSPVSLAPDEDGNKIKTISHKNGTVSTAGLVLIGEHDNSFDVKNTYSDPTTTGLIVKNLPFIVMIALGVLAFLGLTKKRRAND